MIDIHTHIIQNLDDGSRSIEDSIEMIKDEIASGVDTIYATPHHIYGKYNTNIEDIKEQYNKLIDEAKKQNLNINIYLGQEIYYSSSENIIDKLNKGELLTLNNSKYILLEFSYINKPLDLEEIIYNFGVHGYKVIIAHIERYEWIKIEDVINLKKVGAIIQVNSGSCVNKTTIKEYLFVKKLLKLNLVDVIASDIHSFRKSYFIKAYKRVKNKRLFEFKI